MKIKKFKNLWTMGLIISASILLFVYILKIFFPSFVIEVAQIENITSIGHYIDEHKWAWHIVTFIITFIVYYLTICACCNKKKLTRKEIISVICTIILLLLIKEFLPSQYTSANISSVILLPMLFKGNFKSTAIFFTFTNFAQTITLEIRNLSLMIADYNYATFTILMIDVYILQVLLYFYFNYKKGET